MQSGNTCEFLSFTYQDITVKCKTCIKNNMWIARTPDKTRHYMLLSLFEAHNIKHFHFMDNLGLFGLFSSCVLSIEMCYSLL